MYVYLIRKSVHLYYNYFKKSLVDLKRANSNTSTDIQRNNGYTGKVHNDYTAGRR